MALIVRAFPVLNRKGVDAFVREISGARRDAARAFYNEFGVRRESWFLQDSADGAVVIGVTDIEDPVEEKAAKFAEASDPFSLWFKAHVYALSGVDADTTPMGPTSEMVHDSSDGRILTYRTLVVRAYPLRSREKLHAFIAELRDRAGELRDFYARHRVEEAWFLQNTARGAIVIAVAATDDPEHTAKSFQESRAPFDVWFKQRVIELSGVDPNRTPLGPPSACVFEFFA